jgi:two-component system response regulator EvgA
LLLLCEGDTNKQIAESLKLSARTIEAYRARLMRKLRVGSFPELVRYAVRSEIIQA